LLQEREDGRTISLKQQYFFIVNDKQIEANNKEVEKLLKDEDKDAWKTFSKQNKIKWKSVDSLKEVLHFICQHL
jgi:predicted phage-related endonuclease